MITKKLEESTAMKSVSFSYRRSIYLRDTDAAGVLYFASGMSLCHEAYEEWLQKQGINLQTILQEKKIALPIVHCQIDFLRPIFCRDFVEIQLQFTEVTEQEFTIAYQIFSVSSPPRLLIKALSQHVCINPQTRTRMALPEKIKNSLLGEL